MRTPKILIPGLLLALFAAGCATTQVQRRDAAVTARTHEVSVSAEDEARYRAELKANPAGPQAGEARYFIAQAEYNRGDYAKAEAGFRETLRRHGGTGWDSDAYYMLALCLEKQGRNAEALEAWEALAAQQPAWQDLPEQARRRGEALLRGPLNTPDTLAALAVSKTAGVFGDLVATLALEGRLNGGDVPGFMAGLDAFRVNYPQSSHIAELEGMARNAWRKVPVKPRLIGLLAPAREGRDGRFGSDVENGVRMALEEANQGRAEAERFELAMADEGATSLAAAAAARRLVDQNQVIGVIGPVFSDAAEAAAAVATRSRVPVISPAAPMAVLDPANAFFFRSGTTPEKQARQMADHAVLQLKLNRLGVLYPGTGQGVALAKAFEARVAELGATLAASVSYTAGTADFKAAMLALGGVDPGIYKDAEVEGRKEQQAGVERACNALAEAILAAARKAAPAEPAAKPTPLPRGVPTPVETPVLKVAVVDFGCDSQAAAFKAGRAFADRFWRTLRPLSEQQVEVAAPNAALEWLAQHRMYVDDLNPAGAATLGRGLGADLVLVGTVAEMQPDWADLKERLAKGGAVAARAQKEMERAGKYQVFKVTAQLVDCATGAGVASKGFEFTKLRPLPSNSYGLQGLYLPVRDASEVMQIAPNLAFYELRLQLLGGGTWHSRELLREAEALEGARFTVGFYPGQSSEAVQRFVKAYQERYAAQPDELAAQSYDAARMMLEQMRHGAATREDLRDGLQDTKGFAGVAGEASFGDTHDARKKLPILQVSGGEFKQVQ